MAASALCWALRAARQVLPSQTRGYYVDWRMLRDVKRRKLAYEYADERLRINAIRKNTILPKELQEPQVLLCRASLKDFYTDDGEALEQIA